MGEGVTGELLDGEQRVRFAFLRSPCDGAGILPAVSLAFSSVCSRFRPLTGFLSASLASEDYRPGASPRCSVSCSFCQDACTVKIITVDKPWIFYSCPAICDPILGGPSFMQRPYSAIK